MSCLVVKNDGIGDLVLASGIIAELSKMFDGKLDLVTCEANREIAENLYGVRRCFYVSRDDLRFSPRLARLGILKPVARGSDQSVLDTLRATEYEYALCLRRFIRESSLVLMHSTRARHKHCGWQFPTNTSYRIARKSSRGWHHFSGCQDVLSELTYYRGFVESVLGTEISPGPRLVCTERSMSRQEAQNKVGIGLGPVKERTWPIGYWIDLVMQLEEADWQVVLFGGPDVVMSARWIERQSPSIQNLVGSLSFTESVAHLEKLPIFIGDDTGFSHFASLVVPSCLVILGGGNHRRFFPWPGARNQHVIYHALDCFDCNWRCKYRKMHCINLVRSSDVLSYFEDIVSSGESDNVRNLNPLAEQYQVAWRRWDGQSTYLRFGSAAAT